jgi:hypothetical protein
MKNELRIKSVVGSNTTAAAILIKDSEILVVCMYGLFKSGKENHQIICTDIKVL